MGATDNGKSKASGGRKRVSEPQPFSPAQLRAQEALRREHSNLLKDMKVLEKQHAELQKRPRDMAGHHAHRDRLQQLLTRLRRHIVRLRKAR